MPQTTVVTAPPPQTLIAPADPAAHYRVLFARLQELRWLDDPLGIGIQVRLQFQFTARMKEECTALHQQMFPKRRRINFAHLPQAAVAAIAERVTQELLATLQRDQAEYRTVRDALDDLAAMVELLPTATETCVEQSYFRTYGSQTQERKYAREELGSSAELLTQGGFSTRIEETDDGFTLWSNAEPWQLDALRRRGLRSPLEWAVSCWRRGVNPKVYNPFLDDDLFEQSLEVYAQENSAAAQRRVTDV